MPLAEELKLEELNEKLSKLGSVFKTWKENEPPSEDEIFELARCLRSTAVCSMFSFQDLLKIYGDDFLGDFFEVDLFPTILHSDPIGQLFEDKFTEKVRIFHENNWPLKNVKRKEGSKARMQLNFALNIVLKKREQFLSGFHQHDPDCTGLESISFPQPRNCNETKVCL